MNARETAEYIFEKDLFSQWLGIELVEIKHKPVVHLAQINF